MYTGRLIEGLLDMAERVRTTARVRQSQNMDSAALGVAVTVCILPPRYVPPPLTVPSALGEALTAMV